MSQNHFTLSFSLKSPADAKELAEQLPPLMPELFQAEDTIGTIHYSRFTVLSERTLLFLGDFDGEFSAPTGFGSRNIFKGYFGLGPVLETPLNKNAIVIPGNVHRLHDLQVGVILRAFEYQYNLEQKS